MTDGQWALAGAAAPGGEHRRARGQAREVGRRLVLDAIFYLVRGGIAWRALPADFPPHQTVYALFHRWTRAWAWCRIYAALRERARLADRRGPVPTGTVIDSQTVRAADTVPTASSGYDDETLPASHHLDRRHLAAQQPPHPLTQFTDALKDRSLTRGSPCGRRSTDLRPRPCVSHKPAR